MGVFMKVYKGVKRAALLLFVRLTNRVENNSVMFIPHENGNIDGYDIINYHSDNVYCLFNYMLRQEKYSHYTFYLLVDNVEKIPEYSEYCASKSRGVKVIYLNKNLNSKLFFSSFARCRVIFTTHMFLSFGLKRKQQEVVCLGYFTPFKNDFVWTSSQFKEWIRSSNKNYNYHISTSDFSSRILSSDNGLYYNKFLPLGMPRNDLFMQETINNPCIIKVNEEFKKFDKILLYTPTYRDYESNNKKANRSIFGYTNDIQPLIHVLQKHNAVLIAKLHPLQNNHVIDKMKSYNIVAYNTCQQQYSLYDLMSVSNALITDYTSTYFDYLLLNKPVLFNFYDRDIYQKTRGFSVSNIDELCAGPIVTCFEDFVIEIDKILSGDDIYKSKREWVNSLINLYHDNKSAVRITNYFFK